MSQKEWKGEITVLQRFLGGDGDQRVSKPRNKKAGNEALGKRRSKKWRAGGTDLEPNGSPSRAVHKEPGKQGDSPQKASRPSTSLAERAAVRPNKLRPAPQLVTFAGWHVSQRLPHHGREPLPSAVGTAEGMWCLSFSGAEVAALERRINTLVAHECSTYLRVRSVDKHRERGERKKIAPFSSGGKSAAAIHCVRPRRTEGEHN